MMLMRQPREGIDEIALSRELVEALTLCGCRSPREVQAADLLVRA